MNRIALFILIGLFSVKAYSTEKLPSLHKPLNIPLVLSGNFGELRSNHFHSGLDFKTQGKTGFKIYCAEDGYVSRVLVSPWGFGRAVYVTHPSIGLVTVYGHLQSFGPKIDKIIKAEQYKQETFSIDMEFKPNEIPVKRGEVIAFSGNAGSSGGPHLHMDVRDLETGDALDPMPYFKGLITDNVKPDVRTIALYPHDGVVDDTIVASYRTMAQISTPFTAWGKVIPGIKAYDKMPNVSNIYGVKYLTLKVDGEEVYHRVIDRFSFDVSRAVNTLVNYPDRLKNSWVMTTYVPESNMLSDMINVSTPNGVIDINEERDYNCQYILSDEHGNRSSVKFIIRGKRSEIPQKKREGILFRYNGENSYNMNGLSLKFSPNTFYEDIFFDVKTSTLDGYNSDVHKIGDTNVPLHKSFDMKISLTNDNQADKSKYCIVRINGKRRTAVATKYEDGNVSTRINEFGRYAVTIDNTAPKVLPRNKKRWAKNGRIEFKISDNLSGIETYRGVIDGKWVMFEYDGKNALLSYKLEPSRVKKGKSHKVKMVVTDACGNKTIITETFTW